MRRHKTAVGGFTYLWLLFVMALGGVALAALGQRQQLLQQREREAELRFRGEAIAQALASYARATPSGANPLPQRLEDLLEDRRSGLPLRHLRRIYVDPFTGQADWVLQIGELSPETAAPPMQAPPAVDGVGVSQSQPRAEGQALMSGIVGLHSRSRHLLLASPALAPSAAASAPKARVSDWHFKPSQPARKEEAAPAEG